MSEPIEPVTPEIVPEVVVAEDPPTRSGKRLTKQQWLEIEDHVAYNTMSRKELEDHYDISGNSIRSHFKRLMAEGVYIGRGSKRHLLAGKTAAAVAGGVAGSTASAIIGAFASKRKERIEQTKTTLFQQSQIIQTLLNMTLKDIADLTKPDKTAAALSDDIKALQRAENINASMVKTRWILLDIENDIDEATMPKLLFEDLTQAEITALQNASEEDDGDDLDLDIGDTEIVEEGKV
jgi:hypothetical protein